MPEDDRRLGNLVLVRELGRGGMGTVWEARQGSSGQRVAVKCLHPEKTRSDRALARFRREAEALSRVSHPVIVPVIDAHLDGDRPYLVMPYVEGRSLWEIVRGLKAGERDAVAFCIEALPEIATTDDLSPGAPGWTRAIVRLGRDLAEALAVAHAQGLVHRDLKPGNIMVDERGAARLLDFGLVRDDRAPTATLTLSHERLGTPLYMSPEQVTRRQPVDHRTDLYALGVSLLEALTFEAPLRTDDLSDLYRAIVEDDPMGVARGVVGLPSELLDVLSAAVRKEPRDRYQDAGALARDLGRVLDDRAPEPPRVSLPRRVGALLRSHVRAGAVLALLASCAWLVTSSLDDQNPMLAGPEAVLLLANASLSSGDYGNAVQHFNDVLARHPGDDRAVSGLRSVATMLADRARKHEERFGYAAAAADLTLLRRIEPEGVAPGRVTRFESLAYRTLGSIALMLLDVRLPLERRLRSLERLREHTAELSVPADERERLLLKLLDMSVIEPRVTAAVLTVAAGFRVGAAAPLARRFLDDDAQPRSVRLASAVLLARVGVDAGREVLERMAGIAGPQGEEALIFLADLGHAGSTPIMLKELASDDASRVRLAARGLSRTSLRGLDDAQRARVASALSRLLATVDDVATAASAVAAAGVLAGSEGEELLVTLLLDPERPVAMRAAAARWLGRRRSDKARSALISVLGMESSKDVRGAAALALRPRTPPTVDVLMRTARGDPDENVRARALIALGRGRIREALGPAINVLRTSLDARARVGAILSLGLLREPDREAVDLLTKVLRRGGHPHERLSAAWALGRLDDPTVLPALIAILRDESARIDARERARGVLVGASSGLAVLLSQLGDVGALMGGLPVLARAGERMREPAEAIAMAIAELVRGTDDRHAADARRAVDALIGVARDARRSALRAAAVTALGRLPAYVDRSGGVLRELHGAATRRDVRRALALALTRLGDVAAGEAWLEEPPRDGEDALVRALVLLRLGREAEARGPFFAAVRLGVLDRTRLAMEPEFIVFARLADVLGL